jgi:multidrug efflux pump subunit AcrB
VSQPESNRLAGIVAWMVENRVTPNLLMVFLIAGGLYMSTRIKQEVFPEFIEDTVTVSVALPGASPEEVEQGVVLAVEEAIRSLEGVKEITARASEGSGSVRAELMADADQSKVYQDIKQEVDRITTFPAEAEEPDVTLESRRRDVMDMVVYGDVPETVLRELAEHVRDRLLQAKGVTQVDLTGQRNHEIHIEVPEATLRTYGLSLTGIANRIRQASVEVGSGKIETAGGQILLRVNERKDWAREFARIPVVTTPAGAVVYLEDIAKVSEGFEDVNRVRTFDGYRSIGLDVYRVGEQTPISVSEAVRAVLPEIQAEMPPGVQVAIRDDDSEVYKQRLTLLLKNAFMGLVLVLLVLGLFLEFKLAFWVTMGIPTSFLGALLFLPAMDVSINMISMFAFIVALGIVVDDAIVAGENIYEYRERGMTFAQAAIQGARDVSMPIAFSIFTNIVAFIPLYFIPGTFGKIWKVIPLVVVTTFLISWLESLLILPSHLAHTRSKPRSRFTAKLHELQQRFSRGVARFIENVYGPFLDRALRWRGLTVALGVALLVGILGYVFSGRMGLILMPRVESDTAAVTARLPVGSPLEKVAVVRDRLVEGIRKVAAENGGENLITGVSADIQENTLEVFAYLTPPEVRPVSTTEVTRLWREAVGQVPGVQSLRFQSDRGGPGSGAALTIELSHRDITVLDRASSTLAARLAEFPNTKDIDDGYTPGKRQLDFKITPEGESLGLTAAEIARQVRNSFYGAEALRQQRGRNEIKVMVRRPERERQSEYDIENLLISTPQGTFVPLMQVAEVQRGRAYTSINRREGRRTVAVTADVDPIGETSMVQATLDEVILPQLVRDFPGLTAGYEGRQADMAESMRSLGMGFVIALISIYFLLAIPFRSYTQPAIVMISIPFGIVGVVLGHMLLDYNLSLMSLMGIIALSGVVVNDSLVLIDYANIQRRGGATPLQAIRSAGVRRFRPIILTTLTTFGGLAPMIFETSRQARFMIPMALSLGFGILFATVIALLLVPCLYLMIEDAANLFRSAEAKEQTREPEMQPV